MEKSGAQCGGGRARVDRRSNIIELNEGESVEKSTGGRRWIKAQQRTE